MLKLLTAFLLKSKKSFAKCIKLHGKLYLLSVEEYVPAVEQLKKWESALNVGNTQSTGYMTKYNHLTESGVKKDASN